MTRTEDSVGAAPVPKPRFWAWAGAIARRRVASLIRREERRLESAVSLSALSGLADPGLPNPSPRLRPLLAALADTVEELTPSQAILLWVRIQTDATWREAGVELGVAATAAKRRYQRLVAALRRRCARVHS